MDGKRLAVCFNGLGVVGAFLQIAGANWDVSSHILGIVDSFFTPPHSIIYFGILLALIAGLAGVSLSRQVADEQFRPVLTGFKIALSGSLVQLIAGPLDFWWHATFGFDPYLFTPTHSMLIIGLALCGAGMAVGVIRLLQTNGTKLVKLLVVLSLGTLWLDLNFLVLWLTNAQGVAYTFQICSPDAISARRCAFVYSYQTLTYVPALFLDALGGTALILLAQGLFSRRGALTLVAAIVVAVNAAANLGFSAFMLLFVGVPGSFYFTSPIHAAGASIASIIPFYLALLAPVALLDALGKQRRRRVLIVSVFAGPLSIYLDGRFSVLSGLWSPDTQIVVFLVPMLLGGLFAGGLRRRLGDVLLPTRTRGAFGRPFD